MKPSTHRLTGNRLLSVDSLRGFAMVLVVLQHSYLSADMKAFPHLLDMLLWGVTGLAAVAFMSISGMMYSYFLFSRADGRVVYRRYVRRALFLILAAHPAINLLSYPFRAVEHGGVPDLQLLLQPLSRFSHYEHHRSMHTCSTRLHTVPAAIPGAPCVEQKIVMHRNKREG
ncbi:MAG: DUF1624 domain-containing protein [Deltaproteobacteria bacterium]|nr:DUF1624 domain-containing protein [Deltaproteobacteria bacterium]